MKLQKKHLNWMKNLDSFISKMLLYIPFPSIASDRSTKDILLVRPGGLGDLVLLTHSLRAFTNDLSHFTFLIETRSEEWAKFLRLNYVCYDRSPLKILLTKKFHTVVCTEQFFGLAGHFSRFLKAKHGQLIGFDTTKSSAAFTRTVKFVEDLHESSNFTNLLGTVLKQDTNIKFNLPTNIDVGPQYEVIVLGGFESESRCLNLEDWLYLIKKYSEKESLFKIVAAPNDVPFARALALKINCEEISVTFQEAVDFVTHAKSILTIDSGFVHVSSYFGVPAKVLFTSGNPNKWAPLSVGSTILSNDFGCQPCAKFGQVPQCAFSFRCKSNLSTLKLLKVID